jgi:hypothetical protein
VHTNEETSFAQKRSVEWNTICFGKPQLSGRRQAPFSAEQGSQIEKWSLLLHLKHGLLWCSKMANAPLLQFLEKMNMNKWSLPNFDIM